MRAETTTYTGPKGHVYWVRVVWWGGACAFIQHPQSGLMWVARKALGPHGAQNYYASDLAYEVVAP